MSAAADTLVSTHAGSLSGLVRARASARSIAAHLDSLSAEERLSQVLSITGSSVGKLYDLVAGSEPLTLADIVPEDEKGTVILEGRNSLPTFSRFQKRFTRVGDTVVGYNHQTLSVVTGPGYFVVRPATRGEVVSDELFFDYTTDPPSAPVGWPPFTPNDVGVARLVYMNMKDYCRRVGKGVLVGKAYKLGAAMGAYFTLTRPF